MTPSTRVAESVSDSPGSSAHAACGIAARSTPLPRAYEFTDAVARSAACCACGSGAGVSGALRARRVSTRASVRRSARCWSSSERSRSRTVRRASSGSAAIWLSSMESWRSSRASSRGSTAARGFWPLNSSKRRSSCCVRPSSDRRRWLSAVSFSRFCACSSRRCRTSSSGSGVPSGAGASSFSTSSATTGSGSGTSSSPEPSGVIASSSASAAGARSVGVTNTASSEHTGSGSSIARCFMRRRFYATSGDATQRGSPVRSAICGRW